MSSAPSDKAITTLQVRLGHEFREPARLREALTHRSAGGRHNERLEFLGDAILNCVIADALFRHRPDAPEGDLSRLRASLVRERTLAEIAAELDLGAALRLGAGEMRTGGFRRDSILADALEAVLGGIYLDAGFDTVHAVIMALYRDRLEALPEADSLKDPKTRLQEWLQARGRPLPRYHTVSVTGAEHARRFVVRCELEDADLAVEGEGGGRRRAEQAAAEIMLQRLEGRTREH